MVFSVSFIFFLTVFPDYILSGQVEDKIVGGSRANIDDFEFYVALAYKRTPPEPLTVACGSTLIKDDIVLTAAHCFRPEINSPTNGYENLYDALTKLSLACLIIRNQDKLLTTNVVLHEDWDPAKLINDVALVRLERKVQGLTIAPLAPKGNGHGDNVNRNATIVGYGSLTAVGPPSCRLQEVVLKIITKQECRRTRQGSTLAKKPGVFCTYALGKDSCQGDSGGGVFISQNGVYKVQGIVSYGEACAVPSSPGVNTDVSYYHDWITNTPV